MLNKPPIKRLHEPLIREPHGPIIGRLDELIIKWLHGLLIGTMYESLIRGCMDPSLRGYMNQT